MMKAQARSTTMMTLGVSLSLLILGCGSNNTNQGTEASAPAAASARAAEAAATPRCRTAQLKADVQLQKAESALVQLTNKSKRPCTVNGYLTYGGLLADNTPVKVPTKHIAHPGPPVLITLKPGTTASSGLKWDGCNKADENCKVLFGATITPPGERTQLTATVLGLDGKPVEQITVAPQGFTSGSLQPAAQGVTFD